MVCPKMKKKRATLGLLLIHCFVLSTFSLPIVNAVEDSWVTLEPLPTPFGSTYGAAAVDGKIYFIGSGINAQYDPETDNWTQLAPLPIYNWGASVVACQNKIYVIGGTAEIPTQIYDPATDTWENGTSIPTTRSGQQANVVDDKIYVIGGQAPAALGVINPSNATDVYDPATDSWSKMASVPISVMGYASVVVDNKIYIISGGHTGGPDYTPINQVQIFDPATNQWTNGTPIPTAVCGAGACATTGTSAPERIYVIGGTLHYYYHSTAASYGGTDLNQIYDPETDTWTTGISMPTIRSSFALVNVDDALYAIGGSNGSAKIPANEKYTPIGYIPEFPSWVLLPLLLVATLVAIICKQKLPKNR
jgi:N-acetylneuraminic acid mutarotase